MNIPLGTPLHKKVVLKEGDTTLRLKSFMESIRDGYMCVTIKGQRGVEEGVLVVEKGNIIGAHYEYLSLGNKYIASNAVPRVLNALLAEHGIYDIFTLTTQQMELLKIFNEDLLLLEHISVKRLETMLPTTFSYKYENQVLEEAKPADRDELLKKYKLPKIEIDASRKLKLEPPVPSGTPDKVATQLDTYLGMGEKQPVPPVGEKQPTPPVAEKKEIPPLQPKTPTPPPVMEVPKPFRESRTSPELEAPPPPKVLEQPVPKPVISLPPPPPPVPDKIIPEEEEVEDILKEPTGDPAPPLPSVKKEKKVDMSEQAKKLRELMLKER